jgi:hypothetical protein
MDDCKDRSKLWRPNDKPKDKVIFKITLIYSFHLSHILNYGFIFWELHGTFLILTMASLKLP